MILVHLIECFFFLVFLYSSYLWKWKDYQVLSLAYSTGFGDIFCEIGVRELQQSANEAFNQFGEAHRQMEKFGIQMLKRLKPVSFIVINLAFNLLNNICDLCHGLYK